MKIPVIIDCDPGVDDAIAIILANNKKELDILAITSVSGNVGIENTTYNARLMAGLLKMDTEVARGADCPLINETHLAATVHGKDGLAGKASQFDKSILHDLSESFAVDLMAEKLRNSKEKVTIIAIGPLTNIAILLKAHPDLKEKIEKISIMGGSITEGNTTSKAEFNFYADPHAAHVVFNSNVPIVLAGLNVTLSACITKEEIKSIYDKNTELSKFAAEIIAGYNKGDTALHDPVAVLAVTNPEIMEFKDYCVNIETEGRYSSGMSFTDERREHKMPCNCSVITKIDREKFAKEILSCF